MDDPVGMALGDTPDHLVREWLNGVFWQGLSECVHVLLKVLLQEVEDQPEAVFAVDKIFQWADVVMINFFK